MADRSPGREDGEWWDTEGRRPLPDHAEDRIHEAVVDLRTRPHRPAENLGRARHRRTDPEPSSTSPSNPSTPTTRRSPSPSTSKGTASAESSSPSSSKAKPARRCPPTLRRCSTNSSSSATSEGGGTTGAAPRDCELAATLPRVAFRDHPAGSPVGGHAPNEVLGSGNLET